MSGHRSFLNMRKLGLSFGLLATLSLCAAPEAQSQQGNETPKGPDQDEVIAVKSNLVNIDVMVRDRKGKYITDLKAEDFTIFENGARQKVEFFDPPHGGKETAQADALARAESQIPRRVPRNIISLVLDGQTTDLTNLKQVREGTIKYIRERVADTDVVGLFAVAGGLQLLQPFTQDKAKLIAAVERAYTVSTSSKNFEHRDLAENIDRLREEIRGSEGAPLSGPAAAQGGPVAAQAMLAARVLQQFLKLRSQLSLQQSRPILAALAAICEALRAVPSKKTLVLFSQGFVTPEVLDWQVKNTIDIAVRANVAIYIIDSTGLRGGTPQSGALVPNSPLAGVSGAVRQEQRIQAAGGETEFDNVRHEGLNREQDILYQISGDTGGKFIKGTNDIAKGLERIDQEIHSRYTLGYRSTDPNFDGGFRKLRLEVRRPDAHVITRAGYYAIPHEDVVLLSPEDKRLLATFAAAEANPALPLFVDLSPFRAKEGRYVVPLSVEVPPGAVNFDHKGDKQEMQLNVLGVVREAPDKILSRLGGSFDISLNAQQYQSILNDKIFFRQDLDLAPGTYSIDLMVKDRLSGKTAARREKLVLPVAGPEFSTSAVVLSRHVEPARQSFAGADGSGDVLSQGGAQIRPSPSKEFRPGDNLIIFFNLYNASRSTATGKPRVSVTVSLTKDNKAAVKPINYELTETVAEPVPHLAFAKYISLAPLRAGKYTAMIEARDTVTGKLVKQEESFVITQ